MEPTLTLNYTDETGQPKSLLVQSKRFTIGRNPDNDLVIADTNLSRRHALIELFDGLIQISDCGSQNGTMVNNRPLTAATTLRNGDIVTLGGSFSFSVQISYPTVSTNITSPNQPSSQQSTNSANIWLHPPVLAAIAIVAILFLSTLVLLISFKWRSNSKTNKKSTILVVEETPDISINETPSPIETATVLPLSTPQTTSPASTTQDIERAASQTMRRISTDEKSYIFTEKAIQDIERKVGTVRNIPSLRNAISSLQRTSVNIAAKARHEGISQPYLVIYMALALTNGGQSGDPSSTAQEIIPTIQALRTTFGDDAESSLIVVAAFKEGIGTKKSHPLLARMRRIANNPVTQRNVWYLHEHGGIDAQAYDTVLTFISFGIIAQDPRRFGIEIDPLAF